MKKNIKWLDRFVRFTLGVFLIAWVIAGGPGWAYFGLYLLATGSWGYCPIYSIMNYQPFESD